MFQEFTLTTEEIVKRVNELLKVTDAWQLHPAATAFILNETKTHIEKFHGVTVHGIQFHPDEKTKNNVLEIKP